jgi:hypothetical protein
VVEHSARFNKRDVIDLGLWWCRRGDLNPHALAGTSPSSWRVCLFRHSDERLPTGPVPTSEGLY